MLALNTLQFVKGVKQMRVHLINTVRNSAADIFSISSVTSDKCYSKGYDRTTIPAITDLWKNPKEPNEMYAMYPAVLFTDYTVAAAELFGSTAILNVSKFIPAIPATP